MSVRHDASGSTGRSREGASQCRGSEIRVTTRLQGTFSRAIEVKSDRNEATVIAVTSTVRAKSHPESRLAPGTPTPGKSESCPSCHPVPSENSPDESSEKPSNELSWDLGRTQPHENGVLCLRDCVWRDFFSEELSWDLGRTQPHENGVLCLHDCFWRDFFSEEATVIVVAKVDFKRQISSIKLVGIEKTNS